MNGSIVLPDFEGVYERGLAIGMHDIKTDTIHFRFKKEFFEFNPREVIGLTNYNGYFYEARIVDLRALKRKMKAHHGLH